ncbi:MAG: Dabb family protein [Oscillospiraceae bacterium]|nr:Dabb family protein [Oscillospiraceae bacterium]
MRHYIIAKFRPDVDWKALVEPIQTMFAETLGIEGITGAQVYSSNSDLENRYHLMIEMEMSTEALTAYDRSELHLRWKETYGPLIESKVIFDREDRDYGK